MNSCMLHFIMVKLCFQLQIIKQVCKPKIYARVVWNYDQLTYQPSDWPVKSVEPQTNGDKIICFASLSTKFASIFCLNYIWNLCVKFISSLFELRKCLRNHCVPTSLIVTYLHSLIVAYSYGTYIDVICSECLREAPL